jgi:hypothetical protein
MVIYENITKILLLLLHVFFVVLQLVIDGQYHDCVIETTFLLFLIVVVAYKYTNNDVNKKQRIFSMKFIYKRECIRLVFFFLFCHLHITLQSVSLTLLFFLFKRHGSLKKERKKETLVFFLCS